MVKPAALIGFSATLNSSLHRNNEISLFRRKSDDAV